MQSLRNPFFLPANAAGDADEEEARPSRGRTEVGPSFSFRGLTKLLRFLSKKKSLHDGRHIHNHIICMGYDCYPFISNGIAQFYAVCGAIEEARSAFESSQSPNTYTWNFLLAAYGHTGHVDEAEEIFHEMPARNVVSWNLMIRSYLHNGCAKKALHAFHQIFSEGSQPDVISFLGALHACVGLTSVTEEMDNKCMGCLDHQQKADLRKDENSLTQESYPMNPYYASHVNPNHCIALKEAYMIHTAIVNMEFEHNGFIVNALVNVYGKCQSVDNGLSMFHRVADRDVVTWTAMISTLSQNGYDKAALTLFKRMTSEGVVPNNITFVCILDACGGLLSLADGEYIHASTNQDRDFCSTGTLIGNALVSLYGKCKRLDRAESIFVKMHSRDVVSWNAMISAFSQNGCASKALGLFKHMLDKGLKLDRITLVCTLDACAALQDIVEGQKLHVFIVMVGFEHLEIIGSALISLYGNCHAVHEAEDTFDRIYHKDLVSWNAMIYAYATNECRKETVDCFWEMRLRGLQADKITFCGVLEVCANLACIKVGREIHSIIDLAGYGEDLMVGTTLLDMYAKCGSVSEANNVFRKLIQPNVVSWTAMIAAFSQNGSSREALNLFKEMQIAGIEPGSITFNFILNACGHVGLVEEAIHYFFSMKLDHGLQHTLDHYLSMIDLLGRAGRLEEAEAMIHEVPIEDSGISWECLLGACRVHGDIIRGSWAAKHCFELYPEKVAPLITLDNIYAQACFNI